MQTGFFAMTRDSEGYTVTKELTGLKIELSKNGSFICFKWKDDEDATISCDFRIAEDDLREFLDNKELKHGFSSEIYGQYWKIIKE